uniref:Glycosyltransferase family 2 protein n=1 Tax=Desulfatirhabdium butyrativorans TaxID=340467 RepID=A0A7C4RI96_9BACT
MTVDPDFGVVIPNWNGRELLPVCLTSVFFQTIDPGKVVVVDNGSSDGSVEWIRSAFPAVRVIANDRNRGFGAAVNEGILACNTPFVFLLNNDTEMAKDCLERLLEAAQAHPEYGSYAPKMVDFFDRRIIDGAGDAMGRWGAGYRIGTGEIDEGRFDRFRPVFGPCAGAALYRRRLFEAVGLFDEAYFAYLEDVDLNFRANAAGYSCLYVPTARVYHMGSRSGGGKLGDFVVRLTTRNLIRMIVKQYSVEMFIRWFPWLAAYQLWWLSVCIRYGRFGAYRDGLAEAAAAFPKTWADRIVSSRTRRQNQLLQEAIRRSEREIVTSILRRRRQHRHRVEG